MGACSTSCCGPDGNNVDTHQTVGETTHQKPLNQKTMFEIVIKDEKQLRRIEAMIEKGISTAQLCKEISMDPRLTLKTLAKEDKTMAEYELLCLKDAELSFKAMEQSTLKYMGQVRMMPIYGSSSEAADNMSGKGHFRAQQGNDSVVDYEYTKCGYGKLIWPDGSNFEGYWINGQACGLGVFRAPSGHEFEVYEGLWQQDRSTNLCVFRQNVGIDIQNDLDALESLSESSAMDKQNGKGIEVWSDGSYYHGNFKDGVKEGLGVYFWGDGSKYTGSWASDEMSGSGCFQWADGRYFSGSFLKGVMHGFGNYVWQDGRKYEGDYRFNKKHGNGTYTYSDGSRYSGEWVDGMQHGYGCIISAESSYEKKGYWEQGKLKQWITAEDDNEEAIQPTPQ